jgi:hypothetical protein
MCCSISHKNDFVTPVEELKVPAIVSLVARKNDIEDYIECTIKRDTPLVFKVKERFGSELSAVLN